ncbi:MAG: vWA domain-containing protein [Terriglobales bacterium]
MLLAAAAAQTCTLPVNLIAKSKTPGAGVDASEILVAKPADARVVSLVAASPARVLLMIDASGSMNYGHRWPAARDEVRALLAAAPAGVEVGLAAFNDEVRFVTGLAPPPDLMAPVDREFARRPRGGSAIYDAIAAALPNRGSSLLRAGDAIVVLSDGDDNASRFTLQQIVTLVQRSGLRVFLLGNPDNPRAESAAQRIADSAGGAMRNPTKPSKDAQWLWDLLAHQYMLTIGYAGAAGAGLELHAAPSVHLGELLYARKLAHCAPAPPSPP